MGVSSIGIGQLILIFSIVLVLFGTKKLKGIGEDLGQAIKGFRKALNDNSDDSTKSNSKELQ